MTNFPLISIITPSYNQVRFIETTLRSVLDQDYPNIEYLVVDGGSDDGSVELLKRYTDRISWWVTERDSGQAEAINKGLSRAKGEYVAWLNSDDYYMPGAVSEAVNNLMAHPDAGIVFGNVRVVDRDEKVINNLTYANWNLIDLLSFHIIGQPGVFMRHSVLESAGYLDQSYHLLLDHQLWIRMAQQAKMVYVPSLWASAHYHEDCKNLAMASDFGKEAQSIVQWVKGSPDFDELFKQNYKKILAGAERLNAFYLLDAKEYRSSFRSYWKAFWLDPATVKPEWYRMVYAFFAPLGLEGLKKKYLINRQKKLNQQ